MKAIVSVNDMNGIGFKGLIPWKCQLHINFLKQHVVGDGNNAVVMGHQTFKSMHYRPIPGVRNYILSRNPSLCEKISGDVVVETCEENIWFLNFIFEHVYVLGGQEIFSLFKPYIDTVYVFHIHNENTCDRFFPIDLNLYVETVRKKIQDPPYSITYCEYERKSINL